MIADLRTELGLSLEEFAARIGLASRGRMSVIERENRCAPGVALKIEELSGGRIDASDLNDIVRAARAERTHDVDPNAGGTTLSAGKNADDSPFPATPRASEAA